MSIERDVFQKESDDDRYFDWKGREADPRKHGGTRAAAFACGMLQLQGYYFFFYSSVF